VRRHRDANGMGEIVTGMGEIVPLRRPSGAPPTPLVAANHPTVGRAFQTRAGAP